MIRQQLPGLPQQDWPVATAEATPLFENQGNVGALLELHLETPSLELHYSKLCIQ